MLLLVPLMLLGCARRQSMTGLGGLAATAACALLANAVVCGVFANPHDRYGARLVWLAPLVVGLAPSGSTSRAGALPRASSAGRHPGRHGPMTSPPMTPPIRLPAGRRTAPNSASYAVLQMRRLELWTVMRAPAVAALAALLALRPSPCFARTGLRAERRTGLSIDWEVKNRFRLFERGSDFQRHVDRRPRRQPARRRASARKRAPTAAAGRRTSSPHLCVNAAGFLLETCERDGERENYLAPKTHPIVVRLTGAVPQGATCNWSFDDGTIPPKQVNAPCSETVQQRLAYGKPTIAAVGITRPDNSVESASTEIQVRDLLIAGLGDSVAAGEGNPDRPVALADEGFCFRRFLGAGARRIFPAEPRRLSRRQGLRRQSGRPGAPIRPATGRARARCWMSAACHRSLYGYQLRTALAVAIENRHAAVTFIPLACSGATIDAGLFGAQGASECPPTGRCAGTVPAQVAQLAEALTRARTLGPGPQARSRAADGRRQRHQVLGSCRRRDRSPRASSACCSIRAG